MQKVTQLQDSALTVGQVARKFKLTLQTLYFYEAQGLINPERNCGKRFYDPTTLRRLSFILEKRGLGHSLTQIALLLSEAELLVVAAQLWTDTVQPTLELLA